MTALKLQNVSKYYTSQTAVVMGLSDISLEFSEGEFVAITGENGSGKSTLANVIGGMLSYEGGELYVMGQPTSHYNAADWERYRRDLIGFISQDYGILPGNTVFENVESALVLSGCDKALAKERTRGILKQVELSDFARRRAAKLSSGQKQRLAIARALAKPSRILIADEPTGNLDRENSDKVIRLLKEASKDRLVILITHEFSEAKDYITRHIVLSDGKVVQDTECEPAEAAQKTAEANDAPENAEMPAEKRTKAAPGRKLSAYVARLTAKARPVFFFLTALILVLTGIASFIFIGNFIVSTDDVPSRIYDGKAFMNGDRTRLVLAKDGREPFTEEELALIGRQKHVVSVEEYGYICDVSYYYREGLDYRVYKSCDFFPDYHPVTNPDAYELTVKYELDHNAAPYMQSVSRVDELTAGRMPEGFYEVVSADPNVRAGTQIEVIIKDRAHWAIPEYLRLRFDVVGEAKTGRGLYFSEDLCRMINDSALNGIFNLSSMYYAGGDLGKYPAAPYDAERFRDSFVTELGKGELPNLDWRKDYEFIESEENENGKVSLRIPEELKDDQFFFPYDRSSNGIRPGHKIQLFIGKTVFYDEDDPEGGSSGAFELTCTGLFEADHPRFLLVSPATFKQMIATLDSDQASIFIDDYAYTDRVIDEMVELGFFAVSPYRQGSTTKDAAKEKDRMNLLRISLAASVLTLVLQLILLKVTFSSLKDHYRLLSNMGLRSRTAYGSLALLFLFLTILAELIAALVIFLLNKYGYVRVVNIFKYLEPPKLILIFAVHFVFCVIAYFVVARSLKKQVFSINGHYEDIDGELMEEVMSE